MDDSFLGVGDDLGGTAVPLCLAPNTRGNVRGNITDCLGGLQHDWGNIVSPLLLLGGGGYKFAISVEKS